MAIYMDFDHIKGGIDKGDFKEHMELLSFHWEASTNVGFTSGTQVGDVDVGLIKITKVMDSSAAELFTTTLGAKSSKEAKKVSIIFTSGKGEKTTEFLRYTLGEVMPVAYFLSIGEDGEIIETIDLTYKTLTPKDKKEHPYNVAKKSKVV